MAGNLWSIFANICHRSATIIVIIIFFIPKTEDTKKKFSNETSLSARKRYMPYTGDITIIGPSRRRRLLNVKR